MELLDLEKSQTVAEVESLYEELYRRTKPVGVRLPAKIENSRICSRGDFIQFLLTWANLYPYADVGTYLEKSKIGTGLENLFDEDFGFTMGLFGLTHGLIPSRSFVDRKGEKIERRALVEAFQKSLSLRRHFRIKGPRSFFAIDDWLERIPQFSAFSDIYKKKISGAYPEARLFIRTMLGETIDRGTGIAKAKSGIDQRSPLDPSYINLLSNLFYELIENADRWGRRDPSQKSIRGSLVHFHTPEAKGQHSLAEQQHATPPLRKFLQSHKTGWGSPQEDFLEMSIFDNGPGFSYRISNEVLGVRSQYQHTLSCFKRWFGSSNKENEGQGLFKVLQLLNKTGGFLRYRSANLSLFRDFKDEPLNLTFLSGDNHQQMSEEFDKKFFLREMSNSRHQILKHPFAIGSLLTIVVPVPLEAYE